MVLIPYDCNELASVSSDARQKFYYLKPEFIYTIQSMCLERRRPNFYLDLFELGYKFKN